VLVAAAGMNSVMEGVAAGKPLFCLPYGADQYINAQHVGDGGGKAGQGKGMQHSCQQHYSAAISFSPLKRNLSKTAGGSFQRAFSSL
jgi:UDP:flavonoid glycosyltransferase YjiC (YdhE family)